jgi:hypothetical protein
MELFEVESLPWQPDGAVQEKVLSRESDGVTLTRVAWWPAGLDTSQDGVIRHSYHEEVYLLEGYLTDLTLGQTFGPGCYTSRRPGCRMVLTVPMPVVCCWRSALRAVFDRCVTAVPASRRSSEYVAQPDRLTGTSCTHPTPIAVSDR